MPDYAPHVRSRVMAQVRSQNTGPERRFRSQLHRRGLRYRLHRALAVGEMTVRPDIVFGPSRVAVFVDGCFWHCCPLHGSLPKTRTDYWHRKLERNQARDRNVDLALTEAGWLVLRVWEHEDPTSAADRIERAITDRRTKNSKG